MLLQLAHSCVVLARTQDCGLPPQDCDYLQDCLQVLDYYRHQEHSQVFYKVRPAFYQHRVLLHYLAFLQVLHKQIF